ncbi:MAG: Cna B-type domain-containing protein [Clostridia bacterium]|nr:Cna B-type domain-containing protein [Clostridia bacterium]
MKDGAINLVSDGDTTLGVTNTIPNAKPSVTIKKVDENGQPLSGATFTMTRDSVSLGSVTVSSAGATHTWSDLEPGTYTITELAPAGYETISGNISFKVEGNAIVNPSFPAEVSFDGENYTFTVRNTPTNDGSLKIVKRWQDIHGNNLSGGIPENATLTLYQLAKNEGPKHSITVIFRGVKNDFNDGETIVYEEIYRKTIEGWGTATIEWNNNVYARSNVSYEKTVTGVAGECVNLEMNIHGYGSNHETDTRPYRNRLTIYDDGSGEDVTVVVTANNGRYIAYQYENQYENNELASVVINSSTRPGGGYTMTGGKKTLTLSGSGSWTQTFSISGDGTLTESSSVLPATYNHRPCRYIIAEESVPEGFSVFYSDGNTEGGGYLDNGSVGVLTAYNRKITMNVSLHKADKNHLENGLEGARFQIYKINPEQTGVVYMDWSYNYGSENNYLETASANDCTVTFTDLPIGYYEIVETQAPANYLIDGPFYIKVTKQGVAVLEKDPAKRPDKWHVRSNDSTITVSGASEITVGNSREAKLVKLKKYAENASGTTYGNGRTNVAGAQFKIYTFEEYDTNGANARALTWDSPELGGSDVKRYFAADNETMTSGSDGTFYYGSIAVHADRNPYVIVEVSTPEGFEPVGSGNPPAVIMEVLSNGTDGYNVRLFQWGNRTPFYEGTIDSTGVFYNAFIPNDRKPVSLTVTKKDETNGNPLNGSTFVLYDDAQLTHSVKTYTNTNDSSFTISSSDTEISTLLAPIGKDGSLTLYLKETVAPTGYAIIDHTYEIVITKAATGYAMSIDGVSVTATGGEVTLDVPNPPDGSLAVAKEWQNADGTTAWPEGASVQFTLYKTVNGTKTQVDEIPADSTEQNNPVTLTSAKQTARWDHLLTKETVNGQEYDVTYTAEESGLTDGAITINGAVYDSIAAVAGKTTTFTNYERIAVSFEKTWETGIDPAQYTVRARLNQYVDGVINNGFTLDGQDVEKTLSGSGWTASWNSLPVVNADGHALTYDVTETGVFEGETDVTARFIAVETATGIKNYLATVDVPVTKVWDLGGEEAPAGAAVTAKIYQRERLVVDDGAAVASVADWSTCGEFTAVTPAVTVDITGTGSTWTGSAAGLPKYRYDSAENDLYEIQYTAREISVIASDGVTDLTMEYVSASTANADGSVTITNTPPSLISLNVTKVWDDGNNTSGVRPASITVQLYRSDNFNAPMAGKDIVLSAANSWTGGWTDLDERYTYKVQEKTAGGYAVSYSPANGVYAVAEGRNTDGDTVTITNTRVTPPTGSIEVKKVWQDERGNALTSDLPESVQIELNRTAVQSGGTSVTINLVIDYSIAGYSLSNNNNTGVTYSAHVGDTVMFTFTDFYYQYSGYTGYVSPEIKVAYWTNENSYDHYAEMDDISTQTVGNSRFVTFTVPETDSLCVRLHWGDSEEKQQIISHSSFSGGGNVNNDRNTYPYTLTLNAANGWYATLSGLDPDHNAYTLEEIVPSGAAFVPVSYTLDGTNVQPQNGLVTVAPGTVIVTNRVLDGAVKLTKIVQDSDPVVTLPGAKFQLYKLTTTTADDGQGGTTTIPVETAIGAEQETPANGEITFTNLTNGRYKIVETQAPAGYNMMTSPIFFTITAGAVTWTNEAGTAISYQENVTYTAARAAVADDPSTPEDETSEATPATFTVGNTPGVELPATGGPGTAMYTVSGLALTLGALWMLLRRKREQN